jgi:phage terminase Nu1 subunit (DNA packaging protein)
VAWNIGRVAVAADAGFRAALNAQRAAIVCVATQATAEQCAIGRTLAEVIPELPLASARRFQNVMLNL